MAHESDEQHDEIDRALRWGRKASTSSMATLLREPRVRKVRV